MMRFTEVESKRADQEKLGNLEYGTPFKYSGSRYIKVNKRELGQNLCLNTPGGCSVACNLVLGTLRSLKGDTIVDVLNIEARESKGVASEHLKGC